MSRPIDQTFLGAPSIKVGISGELLGEKEVAPRARFELATLRLTVAAATLPIKCDVLLSS